MTLTLYDSAGNEVTDIFDCLGNAITAVYDSAGNLYDLTPLPDLPIPDPNEGGYIEGRTLVFDDNFNGNAVDETKWGYEIGYVRNNEMQFYAPEQATVENGMLVLTAVREARAGRSWLSASLQTNNKFEYLYGRWEAKIKFPGIVGSFPAFWLLGANYEMIYYDDGSERGVASEIKWPQCGEVDIVEIIPGNATKAQSNLWRYSGGSLGTGYSHTIDVTDWHIYAVEWTADGMEMSVDGIVYKRYDFASLGEANIQAYRLPQYITINLAVGASGGTPPTDCNEMKMYVDWVRVYAPVEQNTFSVLGDSYSTFEGYSEKTWYPNSKNNVTDVTQTWWHLFAEETGMEMVSNVSYSGSCICYDGYGEGTADQTDKAFISRIADVKSAEYIFVFGGTNDSWVGVGLGEYKYSDWTEKDKETFRPAMAFMMDYLTKTHPTSRIVFIMNTGLNSGISESVETICNHYGVDLLKLSNIEKQDGHPSINGMIAIKDQLCSMLNLE
jgi:beta-glucanase (GH16 family)